MRAITVCLVVGVLSLGACSSGSGEPSFATTPDGPSSPVPTSSAPSVTGVSPSAPVWDVVTVGETSWRVDVVGLVEIPQDPYWVQEGARCYAMLARVEVVSLPDGQSVSSWVNQPPVALKVGGSAIDGMGVCDGSELDELGWELMELNISMGETANVYEAVLLGPGVSGNPSGVILGEGSGSIEVDVVISPSPPEA